eukprot:COSAG04_NODE_15084_length_544_cov_0.901124_1_plen_83_part_10
MRASRGCRRAALQATVAVIMLRRRACCPSASQRLSCSAACRSAARSFATIGRQQVRGDDVDGVALAVFGVELRPLQRTAVAAA